MVAIVRSPSVPTSTAITPVGSEPFTAKTSTPAASRSATNCDPVASSPTLHTSRAASPREAAQAQKLAACPPPPTVIAAGVSSSGCSRRSGTIVTSSTRSPIDSITVGSCSGHGRDTRQLLDGGVDPRLRKLDVLQLAGEVRVVGRHVEMPVSREAEQDGPRLACLACRRRLLDHRPDGMRGFGRGQKPLGAGELHRRGEALVLLV